MITHRAILRILVLSLSLCLPAFVYAAPADAPNEPGAATQVFLPLVIASAPASASTVTAAPVMNAAQEGVMIEPETADAAVGASDLAPISSDALEVLDETVELDGGVTIEVVAGAAADLACENTSFTSSIAGGFLSSNPFIRLDKTPANYSAFQSDCYSPGNGQCWGSPRYQYAARWYGLHEWRGKLCARSVQTATNNHVINYQSSSNPTCPIGSSTYCTLYVGPLVGFQVKDHNEPENLWRWVESNGQPAVFSIPANTTAWYQWRAETNQSTDFRLVVRYAKPYDQFDFMMDKRQ